MSVFEAVGGQPFFDALVDRFYDGIEGDTRIRPLYPENLDPGKHALALFLGQYWGGPTTYSDEKGHPRLRMRHAPFAIGQREQAAWLEHMTNAVLTSDAGPALQQQLLEYFATAAAHMVNVAG